jgi:hypothetical protein
MDIKSASKFVGILIAINALNFVINWALPGIDLHWLPVSILGLAIWIFIERPFYRSRLPGTIDSSILAICGLIFTLYILWYILAPMIATEQINDGACSPNSIEKRCYTFSAANCSTIWNRYEADCREEVRKNILAFTPSALTGPATKRCIYKKLDGSFQSARRTTDDAGCKAHFSKVDSPGY